MLQPSRVSIQSTEYQRHETAGRDKGLEWTTDGVNPKGLVAITIDCPKEHKNITACLSKTKALHHIPQSYKHTMATDPEQWMVPLQVEIETLKAKYTWDLIKAPPRVNIMDSMWVFNIKWDGEGN